MIYWMSDESCKIFEKLHRLTLGQRGGKSERALILCEPSGRGCKDVVTPYPSEVAIGSAEPMVFELRFTRS